MLLYWSFMEEMIARGVRVIRFRTLHSGGALIIQAAMGGVDVPLPWCHTRRDASKPRHRRMTGRFRGARLWRHLPLAIANFLGPRLVRFLP